MALHPNAWRNQNIVVLDENSFQAVQLEQSLALATPANEISIEAFWSYQEAYDHCREKTNVGLVFISPRAGVPLEDAIDQLGRFYQYHGCSIRGVIVIDDKDQELTTYRARVNQPHYISTVKRSNIINPENTATILNEIWGVYRDSIEKNHFPVSLQDPTTERQCNFSSS